MAKTDWQLSLTKGLTTKQFKHKYRAKGYRKSVGYPWVTEGVNETNKDQWLRTIKQKNPWLKIA